MEILKLYKERLIKNDNLFFVEKVPVSQFGCFTLKKCKKFIGVYIDDKELIPPVFDNIKILDNSFVLVEIANTLALYDMNINSFLTNFDFDSFEVENDYVFLKYQNSTTSIFDIQVKSFLIENKNVYETLNFKDRSTEYIWVKNGLYFDFIRRTDKMLFTMPGLIMAYDTRYDMYAMNESGTVSCYNEDGTADIAKYRQKVLKAGGYLKLQNFLYNKEDIVDVYGNILN